MTYLLGFNIGYPPFTYLGIHIIKGKPKVSHLQPTTDKFKAKLSVGKTFILLIVGRVQLIKSVIHAMLIYSFHIYSQPVKQINGLERFMRNFIQSGDMNSKKLVIVVWHKASAPYV